MGPGMQLEEIASLAGVAVRHEAGGAGAAQALARGRVVVQFVSLYEAGMHRPSVDGLSECDEAVPASVGRPRFV